MPLNSKQKGNRWEREIAKMYRDYKIDIYAGRQPMSGAIETLKGDINKSHNTAIPIKFVDECKATKNSYSLPSWWKQANEQCSQFEKPLLHIKLNNEPPITVLYSDDLFSIMGALVASENKLLNLDENIESAEEKKDNWDKIDAINKIKFGIQSIKNGLNKL